MKRRQAASAEERGAQKIRAAFEAARPHFAAAAFFSIFVNVLYLSSPLYMLQLYDRVLQSGSVQTLLFLTILLVVALAVLATLDIIRSRLLSRAGSRLSNQLSTTIMKTMVETKARGERNPKIAQAMRDFDTARNFFGGNGVHAFFDAPWTIIFLLVVTMIHPILGLIAFLGTVLFVALVYLNERLVRTPLNEANDANALVHSTSEVALNSAEAIRSMGMTDELSRRWGEGRANANNLQVRAQDRSALLSGIIRFLRLLLQGIVLGAGALLAINQLVTPGGMIAASILTARALAPLELAVTHWKGFISSRQALARVREALEGAPIERTQQSLPKPQGELRVEKVYLRPPQGDGYLLQGISFGLLPGEMLGVVGPSGAGKTSLAKALVGLRRPAMGAIRLDGADVSDWSPDELGGYIGYLPQELFLIAGTVRDNICRFDAGEGVDERVIAASRLAGAHEMILRLSAGYDSFVDQNGGTLSAGQRQRVALARALYDDPSFIVLDEPNSNLDQEGENALVQTLKVLKQRNVTSVVMAHRAGVLQIVDRLLVLRDGRVEHFGPRDKVMAELNEKQKANQARLRAVQGGKTDDGGDSA